MQIDPGHESRIAGALGTDSYGKRARSLHVDRAVNAVFPILGQASGFPGRSDATRVKLARRFALRYSLDTSGPNLPVATNSMKLIIQLPCFNEADQLPKTLSNLPRDVAGFDSVEWLVIDDGSSDGTSEVARLGGADHVLRLASNQGLAHAFAAGLEACCRRGADVIVNLDGDDQYRAEFIPALCLPIQDGQADIVVGCRPIERIEHFSLVKKWLQRMGSAAVRLISGADVADATSGFRAYSRAAAVAINVYSRYTYTLETLVQARQARLVVATIPIEVNFPTRPSRLMRSTREYLWRSLVTMVRSFVVYRPLRFFLIPSIVSSVIGLALGVRFLVRFVSEGGAGNVQSLILAAVLIVLGALCAMMGLIADLLSVNRRLLEDIQARGRRRDWRQP